MSIKKYRGVFFLLTASVLLFSVNSQAHKLKSRYLTSPSYAENYKINFFATCFLQAFPVLDVSMH